MYIIVRLSWKSYGSTYGWTMTNNHIALQHMFHLLYIILFKFVWTYIHHLGRPLARTHHSLNMSTYYSNLLLVIHIYKKQTINIKHVYV